MALTDTIKRPVGPLPLWGWAVVIVGGYFVFKLIRNIGSGGAPANAPAVQTPIADTGVGAVGAIPQSLIDILTQIEKNTTPPAAPKPPAVKPPVHKIKRPKFPVKRPKDKLPVMRPPHIIAPISGKNPWRAPKPPITIQKIKSIVTRPKPITHIADMTQFSPGNKAQHIAEPDLIGSAHGVMTASHTLPAPSTHNPHVTTHKTVSHKLPVNTHPAIQHHIVTIPSKTQTRAI